jgi:hypothetical protein
MEKKMKPLSQEIVLISVWIVIAIACLAAAIKISAWFYVGALAALSFATMGVLGLKGKTPQGVQWRKWKEED